MKKYWQIFGKDHMNIPIDFCRNILTKKKVNQAALYLYLHRNSSGNFRIDGLDKHKVLSDLGLRKWETVRRRLKWLIENKWVICSGDVYYLKSIAVVTVQLGVTTCKSAMFYCPDFTKLKAFAIASWASYKVAINKRVGKSKGPIQRGSIDDLFHPSFYSGEYNDLGNQYLANHFGLSKTTGHNYKQLAKNAGFLKLKPRRIFSGYRVQDLKSLKKFEPEFAKKLVKYKGLLFIQCPDQAIPLIRIKRHRGLYRLLKSQNR